MIREVAGTVFITADCFRDRYHWAAFNAPFVYATGDLAAVCLIDPDARDLRQLVYQLQNDHKLKLTKVAIGRGRFEYFATRVVKAPPLAPRSPKTSDRKQTCSTS